MIYYVRHGQTDANFNRMRTSSDIGINDNGIMQAKETAEQLRDVEFDICFCSPLLRTKQTCEIILKYHPNLTPIYDDRLVERTYGTLQDAPLNAIPFNRWQMGKFEEETKAFGMETIGQVYERVKSFFDEIKSKYKDKNILVVSHGGTGRLVCAYFKGFPKDGDLSAPDFKVKNAQAVYFDF